MPQSPSDSHAANKRFWRFQFTLRQMFVLMVLVALALIWPAVLAKRAHQRAAFADKFAPCTAAIKWDGQKPIEVYLWDEIALSEQQLKVVSGVDSIEGLSLVNCNRIKPDAFRHIGTMTSLKALQLGGANIDDDVLRHLGGLHNLYSLVLNGTNISDRGLTYIRDLPRVAKLFLCDTNVSDCCIDDLGQMDSLKEVSLDRTFVTPKGAERIRKALPDVDVYYAPRPPGDSEEEGGEAHGHQM